MLIDWILGKESNIKENGVIWNAIGGMLNAGQSAIILIFISHKLGIVTAGMVTFAYAIANLFLTIGKYGVRNYQVTDVKEKYSFGDYFYCRLIVFGAVFFLVAVYMAYCTIISEYLYEKTMIVFEIIILKLIDAFEDLYLGRFQQIGRLDIGAKIMAFRLGISTGIICVGICVGIGIYAALLGGIISSVLLDFYCIYFSFSVTNPVKKFFDLKKVCQLLKVCFPLCVGMTLSIYIGNAPKYMINNYMNEEAQAVFGYIMMPVFVIMLLSNFIYQPMVKDLGQLWEEKRYKEFKGKIIKQCIFIAGLTVGIVVVGLLLGLPILSILYGIDLKTLKTEFAILLLGGGAYALAYFLSVPITTIRKQSSIAIGYAIAAVAAWIFGKKFVVSAGMLGASALYLVINILLVIIYILVLRLGIKKRLKEI